MSCKRGVAGTFVARGLWNGSTVVGEAIADVCGSLVGMRERHAGVEEAFECIAGGLDSVFLTDLITDFGGLL